MPRTSGAVRAAKPWTTADTERVGCCVCSASGQPLYGRDPFGVVRCPTCSLVFVSPRLSPDALQRLYDAPSYFEGGVYGAQSTWSPAMVLQRAWMAGRLSEISRLRPPPARLLEIGSGYGLFLAQARQAGYDVRGVELSETAAAHATSRLQVEVFRGQLAQAPAGEADVICFWDTLEHVPDPVAFLREVRRRLAPGGLFALSVPNVESVPAKALGARWWTLKPEQHIWHFSPATLRLLASTAGLVITSVVTSPLRRTNLGRTDSLFAVGRASAVQDRR